jgi:hypothetical protein
MDALWFWTALLVSVGWWLLAATAIGFTVSLGITVKRCGVQSWCRPGWWARLGAASALACAGTVGYGLLTMGTAFKADDPCTIDDELMSNQPIMSWPLSNTTCGGYELVPAFVNPAICLCAILFAVGLIGMLTTRFGRRSRGPSPYPSRSA